jgi:predicted Mrr-cat superfamily restriction endonuclease
LTKKSALVESITLNAMNMRFVEELNNGDKVITYYSVEQINNKFYYVYNDVNHGPYEDFDDAVEAAYEDLILQSTVSG